MNNLSVDTIRENTWKKKAAIVSISLAAAILSIRFVTGNFLKKSSDISNYTILLCVLVLLSLLAYIKRSKEYDKAIFLGILFSFIIIYIRTSFTGGLNSPAAAWYISLPVISSFLLSRAVTYIVSALSLVFIILSSQFSLLNYINLPQEELSSISNILIYISVLLVTTIFCISHGRKREEMLAKIENQKMSILSSSRNIELSELAAGIAQEINNPLAVVKAKAKKIKHISTDNKEIYASSEKILQMSDRISKVVRSMKNLSKAQTNEEHPPKESISYIFENVLTLCETKMAYSNIEFRVNNEIKNIDEIKVPIQLGHILLNLINNAYDAVLNVSRKWIVINIKEESGLLKFSIIDSGKGISKGNEENIFNPYFTEKQNRIGLGLSISKNNTLNIGGEISLDSNAENTTFSITIPAHRKNELK